MAKRSFWEKLGRGVGHGIHKAMELGSQVADQVEGKLELEKAEESLAGDHEALGRAFADALLGERGTDTTEGPTDLAEGAATAAEVDAPGWAENPAVKDLLERIRAGRELVEKLRAEREAEQREAQERDAEERAERERRAAEGQSEAQPEKPPTDPKEPPA